MSYVSEKEAILKTKIIPQTKRDDLEEFWTRSVAEMRAVPLKITREKISTPYDKFFTTYDVAFNTHDKTIVHAYFSCPNNAEGKLPCVAYYHGGSGHRDIYPDMVATGACCFAMDVRSQGGTSRDDAEYSLGDYNGGFMTRGLLDKNEFYMRNIYLDAVRAMDVIASFDEVHPDRIVTYGASQGGALSLVASALSGRSRKCYAIVTSYSCIHRRTELGTGVFESTHKHLKVYPHHTDKAMETLSYFDVNNIVSMMKTPTSFCLGLADAICLPEFVYSAYHHTPCEKELLMYPFVPHTIPRDYKLYAQTEIAKL